MMNVNPKQQLAAGYKTPAASAIFKKKTNSKQQTKSSLKQW
jgi:hypothetical protein